MNTANTMPDAIESVIQDFNSKSEPFHVMDVSQALNAARGTLVDVSINEQTSAWCEVLAFALVDDNFGGSPWGTHFAPMGSRTYEDGKKEYFPDIAEADPHFISHWAARAENLTHPILVARYADLAWDLASIVGKSKPDARIARVAIRAYLACGDNVVYPDIHDRLRSSIRAFDLACSIRATDLAAVARLQLLKLQADTLRDGEGSWWMAFDRLIGDKRSGLTEAQEQELIAGMEGLLVTASDISDVINFNPHTTHDIAKRLISYYARKEMRDEIRRLNQTIGISFEHFASLGNAMLASSVLQTSVNAYRDAGMGEDSQRVRKLMEEKIYASRSEMGTVSTEITIPREDIEKFCASIVSDDLGKTFVKFAVAFLPDRARVESDVLKLAKTSPLSAAIPHTILDVDRVVARIGSVEDDLFGRVIRQTIMNYGFEDIWMHHALHKLFETHELTPDHFVSWANRNGIFSDTTFIREGVAAWLSGDLYKSIHLLVPQVERGLRGIVNALGKPTSKAHSSISGVSVAMSMGDILYSTMVERALGPNLTLHFLAFYADPRGFNLRNEIAHGLIEPGQVNEHLVNFVIHSFLVFGIWKELAERDTK